MTTDLESWPLVAVNDDGIRPAGRPDECLYCKQRVGEPHLRECVVVTKRVRLRYIIEVDVDEVHAWTPREIEFHRGQSSWCANNALDEIQAQADREGCLCPRFRCEFVGVVDGTPTRKLTSDTDKES